MPIRKCSHNGKSGYRWGSQKCYTGPGARARAERQAAAVRASGYVENSHRPLNLDPTRTLTERRAFGRQIRKLFVRLRGELRSLIVDEDAFGLRTDRPTLTPSSSVVVANKRWAYSTNEQAADQFESWLRGQVRKELFSEAEAQRWRRYIGRGFEKGANRALNDVRRGRGKGAKTTRFLDPTRSAGFEEGAREMFLRTTLSRPSAVEKLRLLQSSSLSEVRGLGDDLVTKGRRVLVDSLVRNLSPREIAQRLSKVLKVSEGRARTIANTELVRAHAEGQLAAMEQLGVERVGVAVEWSSLASACSLCSPLNHVVLTLAEARGMLPRHPNCRCAWKVANVLEDKAERKTQKRSKTKIDRAVKKSQREGGDAAEWGPGTPVSGTRPQPVLTNSFDDMFCECTPAESFSRLLGNLGLPTDGEGST